MAFDFPSDYRAFVDRYGGGEIGTPHSLRCFVYAPSSIPVRPGVPTGFKGFVEWHVLDIASMFEGCDEDHWGGTVYPMYPELGGLLTWGENEQGDLFWWLTEGDFPSSDWVRSPRARWTLTSDWLCRGLNVSAGPAT